MRVPSLVVDAVRLRRSIVALAIGVLSALLATASGLPLPWMLGPMIGVAIAALMNAPIHAPLPLRPVVIPAIA